MIRLYLCGTNYDGVWASDVLPEILGGRMKAAVLPLSYDYGWSSDAAEWSVQFSEDSMFRYDLKRPLVSFGIPEKNIRWIDHFRMEGFEPDDYDVLVLAGEDPAECMMRMEDLGLDLQSYRGILIGLSAGASIMAERFSLFSEDSPVFELLPGLGLSRGFLLDMHWQEDEYHLRNVIYMLETQDLPVICIPEDGGLLEEEGQFLLFGSAFAVTDRDLDRLYLKLESC
ncbi:MAG: hypothetical protein IJJ24_06370 [Solobacterium sp.]|nr:hypothetical protein [Solobacterium sp.]